ncbi:helix-turn-helix domain-containing protein [Streptomyces sp. NPDC056638]|uniref:helix-turn-helix domain-containing protein n=1 Tax=Streptomyces sp. NPDC056638 TaxID=3345887 RepID=UPI0036ABF5B4
MVRLVSRTHRPPRCCGACPRAHACRGLRATGYGLRAAGCGLRAAGYGRASSPSHTTQIDTPETCITAAGSIVRTAGLLFRHRNIVPCRLRRIHTITGHDTTNCGDHVELSLALGTLRPLGDSLIR